VTSSWLCRRTTSLDCGALCTATSRLRLVV
jgi:hypothetical protein